MKNKINEYLDLLIGCWFPVRLFCVLLRLFLRNFGVLLLFLCVDLIDYIVKLDKELSIIGQLPYAAFIGSLIVFSLFALRTDNLLFHRVFAVYAVLALLVISVTTLVPLAS